MGRNFVMTKSNRIETGRKKKTLSKSIVIGPSAIKFISLTVVAVLAIVYLSQSTAGATRSIQIRDIQTAKDKLGLEQERLEVEQTRLKALKEIDTATEKQVMEPVSNVNHIN